MEIEQIIELLQAVAYLVLGGLALYLKTSKTAKTKSAEIQETLSTIAAQVVIFIREAEEDYKDTTNAGGAKFNAVVDKVYGLIPNKLKPFIEISTVENMIQSTFDQMELYAKQQLDSVMAKVEEETKGDE